MLDRQIKLVSLVFLCAHFLSIIDTAIQPVNCPLDINDNEWHRRKRVRGIAWIFALHVCCVVKKKKFA